MQREKGEDKSSTAAVRGYARVHGKLCRYSARNSLYPQTVFHCMENFSVFFYAFRPHVSRGTPQNADGMGLAYAGRRCIVRS